MRVLSGWLFLKMVPAVILVAPAMSPQSRGTDSVVTELVAAARRDKHAGSSVRVLSQQDRTFATSIRDALADSLAVIAATGSARGSEAGQMLRMSALRALGEAGSQRAKIPYTGAGARLFRVAMTADDVGIRAAATFRIAALADVPGALELLRRIAVSDQLVSASAVQALAGTIGDKGGLDVLRDLRKRNAVRHEQARKSLDFVARQQGWK